MKRKLWIMLIMLVSALLAVAFAACSLSEHTLHVGEWTTVTPATCIREGEEARICTECGAIERRSIPLASHTPVYDEEIAATCLNTGLTRGSHCRVCNTVLEKQEIILRIEHTWGNWMVYTSASCKEAGLEAHKCNVCRQEETREIPKEEHKFSEWAVTVEATCLEEGEKIRACSVCDFEEKREVEKLPHAEVITPAVEATCTETGWTESRTCSVCKTVLQERQKTEALGHDRRLHDAKAPTCTEFGWDAYETCSRCDLMTKVELPATGHTDEVIEAVEPTCTEKGLTAGLRCSVCKEILIAQEEVSEIGHNWGEWETKTVPTCTVDGEKVRVCEECKTVETEVFEATGHVVVEDIGKASTCTSAGLTNGTHCSVCNEVFLPQTEIAPKGHVFGAWEVKASPSCNKEGYDFRECEVCKATETRIAEKIDHVEEILPKVESSCTKTGLTEGKRCSVCGEILLVQVEIGFQEHTWGEPVVITVSSCMAEGQVKTKCTVCSHELLQTIEKLPHSVVTYPAIPATCTSDGLSEYSECSVCGEEFTECKVIPATGHDWNDWAYVGNYSGLNTHRRVCKVNPAHIETALCTMEYSVVAPTCEEDGYTATHCTACLFAVNKSDLQPKLNHDWSDWTHNTETESHSRVCNRIECGKTETTDCRKGTPVIKEVSCTEDGCMSETCAECKFEYISNRQTALGHEYGEEWSQGEDGVHFRVCVRCDEIGSGECEYDEVVTEPTCLGKGLTTKICRLCKRELIENETEPTGHTWSDWEYDCYESHVKTCSVCGGKEYGACRFEVETIAPTCTTGGYTASNCTFCHYHDPAAETIPALGHKYGSWSAIEGEGRHERKCERCAEIDSASCIFVDKEIIAPTCETRGYAIQICEGCKNEREWNELPARNHAYGQWQSDGTGNHFRACKNDEKHIETQTCLFRSEITLPTCDEGGYTTRICEICFYSDRIDETQPLEHVYAVYTMNRDGTHNAVCSRNETHVLRNIPCEYTIEVIQPTCDVRGFTNYVCRFCEYSYRDNPASELGHDWSGYTFDRQNLSHMRGCLRIGCGETEIKSCTLYALDVVKPTCGMGGYTKYRCDVCGGNSELDPTSATGEHTWSDFVYNCNESTHSHTCEECGMVESVGCSYESITINATCKTEGGTYFTCKVCLGESVLNYTEALGHAWNDWSHIEGSENLLNQHSRKCMRCDEMLSENCSVAMGQGTATCTQPGVGKIYCPLCLYVFNLEELEPLGHAFGEEFTTKVITREGVRVVQHARICTRCNTEIVEDCAFVIETEIFSCTQSQNVLKKCTICSYEEKTLLPALGHKWTARSDGNDGIYHVRICSQCEATDTRRHDFANSNLCAECGFDGLTYEEAEGVNGVVVKGDDNVMNAEVIVVPAVHGDKSVVGIKAFAFGNTISNNVITSILLPNTLQFIDDRAFYNCSSLVSVTFAEGDSESRLREIGEYAFYNCKKLAAFVFPNSLREIGECAFYQCAALAKIEIPAEVTKIGSDAFRGTAFYENPANWNGTDHTALYINGNLIRINPLAEIKEFEIAAGTTTVGAGAFENCTNLQKLIIPNTVTVFDVDSFKGCGALVDVTYNGMFGEWMAIEFKNEYSNPVHINLDTVIFHITAAKDSIEIPDTVKEIPAGTFSGTQITSVTIPASVTSIGARAFYGCSELKTIIIEGRLVSIGADAFTESGYWRETGHWQNGVLYLSGSVDAKYLLDAKPEVVSGVLALAKEVCLIADEAFLGCTQLTGIVLSESVVYIGARAFKGCNALENVEFPVGSTFIYWNGGVGRTVTFTEITSENEKRILATYLRESTIFWKRIK